MSIKSIYMEKKKRRLHGGNGTQAGLLRRDGTKVNIGREDHDQINRVVFDKPALTRHECSVFFSIGYNEDRFSRYQKLKNTWGIFLISENNGYTVLEWEKKKKLSKPY